MTRVAESELVHQHSRLVDEFPHKAGVEQVLNAMMRHLTIRGISVGAWASVVDGPLSCFRCLQLLDGAPLLRLGMSSVCSLTDA